MQTLSDHCAVTPDPAAQVSADVLIIGAGPVGLLLANLLGTQGIRTLVCDQRTTPLDRSMAIGITPPSLEILKPLGLDEAFTRAGVPVRYAEVLESRTCLGRLDFDEIRSDYRFFLSIPQLRTVGILRENLARFASVRLLDGTRFMAVEQRADHIRVNVRDVDGHIDFDLCARFLIGCDGHRSTVRSAAGLAVRERVYPQRFVMADFPDHSGLEGEARLFFGPEASVESFPLPNGCRRWIVLANDLQGEAPLEHLIGAVRRLTGFELSADSVQFVSSFGARRMVVNRYYSGRVALAGDAAHVMSSIGGQGMNTGFADAEMLGTILPAVLKKPEAMPQWFAAYDRVRRRAYKVAARRAEQGMWLGTLRGRVASRFRKLLIRDVLFRPPLRRRLAPHFAMLTIPCRNLQHTPQELLAKS